MEIDSLPAEIDQIRRKIMQMEIEREALKKESDEASRERLKKLEEELSSLKEEMNSMMAQWELERSIIRKIRKTKEALNIINLFFTLKYIFLQCFFKYCKKVNEF